MAKEMEVQKIENMDLILLDKEKVQRHAHIFILQDIVSLPARKNISRNHQNLRRRKSKKRPFLAKIQVMVKKTALHLILPQHLFLMNFIHLKP